MSLVDFARARTPGLWWQVGAMGLAALALVSTATALDVHEALAVGDRASLFAMVVMGLFSMVAGVLFYLSWTIRRVPAHGWVAAALVFLGLHDLPFLLAQFATPTHGSDAVGEGIEVVAGAYLAFLFLMAARDRSPGRVAPVLWGIGGSLASAVLRLLMVNTDVVPDSFADGTALLERLAVLALGLLTAWAAWSNRHLSLHARTVLGGVAVGIGVQCALDTSASPTLPWGPAVATGTVVVGLGLLVLDVAIRNLLDTLAHHQGQLESLVRRVLHAEAEAHREAEILHEVRSTVGGLATASELLSSRPELSDEQRSRLQRAVADQLLRMDRTLQSAPGTVQEFDLRHVLDPVVEFHRVPGSTLEHVRSAAPLVVRHVPDTVAQVVGTLLHNAARHAPGRAVTVSTRLADRWVLVCVSHAGPEVDATVRAHLFERGVRSTSSPGEGIGLHVAQRLLAEHGGTLLLEESGPDLTTFTARLPRASGTTTEGSPS